MSSLIGWRLQYPLIFLLGVVFQQLVDRWDGNPLLVVVVVVGIAFVTKKNKRLKR